MLTIGKDEFDELQNLIWQWVKDRQKGVKRIDIACTLFEFDQKFDLGAMHRFVKWSRENGQDEDLIFATIVHDLNGMNDVCFLPRTDGY